MPAWIHDRAKKLERSMRKTYGPEKAKQVAHAVATQEGYAAKKVPRTWKGEPFGTAKGRREARAKFDRPPGEYKKTADPGSNPEWDAEMEAGRLMPKGTGEVGSPTPTESQPFPAEMRDKTKSVQLHFSPRQIGWFMAQGAFLDPEGYRGRQKKLKKTAEDDRGPVNAPSAAEALLDSLMGPMPAQDGAKTLASELERLRRISKGRGLERTAPEVAKQVRALAKEEGAWMAQHGPSRKTAEDGKGSRAERGFAGSPAAMGLITGLGGAGLGAAHAGLPGAVAGGLGGGLLGAAGTAVHRKIRGRALLGRLRRDRGLMEVEKRKFEDLPDEDDSRTFPLSRLLTSPTASGIMGGLGGAAAGAAGGYALGGEDERQALLQALLGALAGGTVGAAGGVLGTQLARSRSARGMEAAQEQRRAGTPMWYTAEEKRLREKRSSIMTERADDPESDRVLRTLVLPESSPVGPSEGAQFREERPAPDLRGKKVEAAAKRAEVDLDRLLPILLAGGGGAAAGAGLGALSAEKGERARRARQWATMGATGAALGQASYQGELGRLAEFLRQKVGTAKTSTIRQEGNQYVLYSRDGSRVLSRHNSPETAMAQERALLLDRTQGKLAFERLVPHVLGALEQLQKQGGLIDSTLRALARLRGAAPAAEALGKNVAPWARPGAVVTENLARPVANVLERGAALAPTQVSRAGLTSGFRPPVPVDPAAYPGMMFPGGVPASPGLRSILGPRGTQNVQAALERQVAHLAPPPLLFGGPGGAHLAPPPLLFGGPGGAQLVPGGRAAVPVGAQEWTSMWSPSRMPAAPTAESLLLRSGELKFAPGGLARRLPPQAEDLTSAWASHWPGAPAAGGL